MSTWLRTIGLVSLGWMALTCAAAAQSRADYQDMPLGDVWISSGDVGAYQRAPDRTGRGLSAANLVPRFRSSHHFAARSFANFGIEGH